MGGGTLALTHVCAHTLERAQKWTYAHMRMHAFTVGGTHTDKRFRTLSRARLRAHIHTLASSHTNTLVVRACAHTHIYTSACMQEVGEGGEKERRKELGAEWGLSVS